MKKLVEFFQIMKALFLFGIACRRRGWWKKFPFLPLPPKEFIKWRLQTMYGKPYLEKELTIGRVIKDSYHFGRWLKNIEPHMKRSQ